MRAIIEDTSRPCWLALRSIPGGGVLAIMQVRGTAQPVLPTSAFCMSQ